MSTRYRHTGSVLVRATTDPGDLDPPTHLNLSDAAAVEQEGRAWLAKVWARQRYARRFDWPARPSASASTSSSTMVPGPAL